jgi:hypothetical protein
VEVWVTVLIAALIGAGFAWRVGRPRRPIDSGEVSEGWLREHRAEKRRD